MGCRTVLGFDFLVLEGELLFGVWFNWELLEAGAHLCYCALIGVVEGGLVVFKGKLELGVLPSSLDYNCSKC